MSKHPRFHTVIGDRAFLFLMGFLLGGVVQFYCPFIRDADGAQPMTSALVEPHPRSSRWPAVRAAHLAAHPECAACGSKGTKERPNQVHHIIPFEEDAAGDADGDGVPNELDPDNLITLSVDGVGHCNCHLLIGHAGNFRCHNLNVVRDAKRFREMLSGKVCDPK